MAGITVDIKAFDVTIAIAALVQSAGRALLVQSYLEGTKIDEKYQAWIYAY